MNPSNEELSVQISNLQKTLDTHIRDSDEEAKDNQEYRLKVIALEGQVEELRKDIKKTSEKTADKVEEVVAPVVEAMERKSIIKIKEVPFLKWFRR